MYKISLAILSWKAHDTIKKTLNSYNKENLLSLFDESFIYFNQISEEDKQLAKEYNINYKGSPENLGFSGGLKNMILEAKNDYILVLQNDCNLVEDFEECKKQLGFALKLLQENKIDIMRLRHRFNVGEGFSDVYKYLKYYKLRELDEDFLKYNNIENYKTNDLLRFFRFFDFRTRRVMKGRSIYIEKHPELLFPEVIKKENDIFIVDSSVINFTEQSFLISKRFMLELFDYMEKHPKKRGLKGFQVPEIILNCRWWRNQHFKIGVGKGLFSHNRFDDSFRETHQYYNNKI